MCLKKWGIILTAAFAVLVTLGMHATVASADRHYDIDQMHINVDVQKNGNAYVTQRIKYNFDGNFHGVFLMQDYKGTGGIINVPSVHIISREGDTLATHSNSEQPDTFQTSDNGHKYQIKLYHPFSNEKATFIYKYGIKQVIKNWADTAELNWKIIGTGWDVDLNHVKIVVQLPANNVKKLQAWTHGPSSGYTTVDKQKGRVTMTVNDLEANTFVESHMVFPTSVTPDNQRKSADKHLTAVQQQEAALAKKTNRARSQTQLFATLGTVIALVLGFFYLILEIIWFHKHPNKRVKKTPKVHNFEIPAYSAVISQVILTHTEPNSDAFTAWLMELAAAGEITIEPEHYEKKHGHQGTTYRLTETPKMASPNRYDPLLEFLFGKIGRPTESDGAQKTVTLREINDYHKQHKHDEKLSDLFTSWQESQYRRTEGLKVFNKNRTKIRLHAFRLLAVAILVLIVAGFSLIFLNNSLAFLWHWALFIFVVVSLALVIWHLAQRSYYTQKGADAAGRIRNFKYMMHDIGSFERSQVGDLILWEQMMPYAVAFGLADKVVKAMRANFSADELKPFLMVYYPVYAGTGFTGDGFSVDFSGVFETASGIVSSESGGSGGFSVGSSGGFGGGSGGGAF